MRSGASSGSRETSTPITTLLDAKTYRAFGDQQGTGSAGPSAATIVRTLACIGCRDDMG